MSSLCVQVAHGTDKHEVALSLPADDPNGVLTLSHLSREIARITEVPVKNQKIICKGKSLTDQFAPLKTLGVKNNSKIMLLGKKVSQEQDRNMAAMSNIEGDLTKVEKRITDTGIELDGIRKGYLPDELTPEALKKLGLAVGVCAEEFTRGLERLDSLTLAEASPDVRQRRKNLVQRIQGLLDRCDSLKADVQEQKKQL